MLLQGCELNAELVDGVKLNIDGNLNRYGEIKAILSRLAKQTQAQRSPEQHGGYWVDSGDDHRENYDDGYCDSLRYWHYYGGDDWWGEESYDYDDSYGQNKSDSYKRHWQEEPR